MAAAIPAVTAAKAVPEVVAVAERFWVNASKWVGKVAETPTYTRKVVTTRTKKSGAVEVTEEGWTVPAWLIGLGALGAAIFVNTNLPTLSNGKYAGYHAPSFGLGSSSGVTWHWWPPGFY